MLTLYYLKNIIKGRLKTMKFLNEAGQVSPEGLTIGIVVAILYLILAGGVWPAIDNAMGPLIGTTQYGNTGRTLINLAVYLVMPAVIIGGSTAMLRQRTREQEYF